LIRKRITNDRWSIIRDIFTLRSTERARERESC